ncbi:hypothetical protein ACEQ8H_000115 [Pleosporales sp. CAS-2024a]
MSAMPEHTSPEPNEAVAYCHKLRSRLSAVRRTTPRRQRVFEALPRPCQERLDASRHDAPMDAAQRVACPPAAVQEKQKTVLYLAYGSNLCNETFRGVRGIRPLSQVNVLVPSLRLTFDLAGIPYAEPCFANAAFRDASAPPAYSDADYHKDRWHKGLVGVVYEVTLADYAHIMATEGAGASYQDMLVDCYVLPNQDAVPTNPTSAPFQAHTLFAPVQPRPSPSATDGASRPDPSYAQPSARYLKLIRDGATECRLPAEYQAYLHHIRPYTMTTKKQAVGKALFLAIWMPIILLLLALARQVQDDQGRAPKWFAEVAARVFGGMWICYHGLFKPAFGDGERTLGQDEDGDGSGYAAMGDEERRGEWSDSA